ncbi:hypothetical protein LWI28_010353 [Acer negundo]|uniref:C2H2-type domain-containing protein n=1 Tax=Acer negundo TaxID=4023 RepID=A0AAD5P1B9_ACENE|nr:hypothetical protein LWI28_010353 [Acer negundo]KAK4855965.1 hypothetical protein QYF36_012795 [Acer negundo]
MEFWGVEVKAGQSLKVQPTFDNIIHLSQASLGESKKEKGKDSVPVFVKFGDKKLVLGTLIPENIPQLSFDLVFEKEFELSHNWKNGSVYFCGYQTPLPQDDSEEFDMDDSEEEEEEELEVVPAANGKAGPTKVENVKVTAKPVAAKPNASAKPVAAKPIADIKPKEDEDDSDDSDDSMDDQFEDDSDEMSDEEGGADEDDSDDDEDEDDSDEETPKKVEVGILGKKRPSGSAQKTPVSTKKAKAGTPLTDGKRGGHVATPYPSKQGSKTPANGDKTPKSGGGLSCKTCSKTFGTDGALQSHTKAKHSGGK